jgi:hypothetical protein
VLESWSLVGYGVCDVSFAHACCGEGNELTNCTYFSLNFGAGSFILDSPLPVFVAAICYDLLNPGLGSKATSSTLIRLRSPAHFVRVSLLCSLAGSKRSVFQPVLALYNSSAR